jgi:hypothetical protein
MQALTGRVSIAPWLIDRLIDWLWWCEILSQNCGHQRPIIHPAGDIWACRVMVVKIMMMMPAGDNSWLVHQSSLAVLPSEKSRRNGRRRENFAYQYLTHLKGSSTRRKILRNATSSVTSHTKEGLLRIFISLKNPSLWWTNQELSPVDIIPP